MNEPQQISDHDFKEIMINHIRESFSDDFSDSINSQIIKIKDEIKFCFEEAQKYESRVSEFRNSGNKELNEVESEALMDQAEFLYDAHIREQKLCALTEMKIIFLFKNLEITLKQFFELAFSVDANQLFNWTDIKNRFKKENIYLSKLEEYDEVIELKHVSNNLKHSDKINPDVNSISEFKNKNNFEYKDLEKFYSRINSSIFSFISSLGNELIQNIATKSK